MALREQVEQFLRRLEQQSAFSLTDSRLVVGVSGGPDSLSLLHVLREFIAPARLVVAHLNHGWRPSADAEAAVVAAAATAWDIACYSQKIDVPALARRESLSLEEAGRQARYEFLAQVAEQVDAGFIAVGHNADDQAETVLMHILRGSGLAGLRGMLPVSPAPGAGHLTLVRPFLSVTRDEIESYCQTHGLQPITDPSNEDTTFFRNRLRHELLSLLADYNPQIKTRLQQMATLAAADYALLDEWLQAQWMIVVQEGEDFNWLSLDREKWLALPLSLRRGLLRRAVWQLRPWLRDVAFQPVEQARLVAERGQTGAQAVLPGAITLTVEYDRLLLAAEEAQPAADLPQLPSESGLPLRLPLPGRVALTAPWVLEATWMEAVNAQTFAQNQDPWQAFVDVGDEAQLLVRPRRPGERLQPLGMDGRSTKIKELMINRKISARLRSRWPLVTSQAHPVWLVGHHIDERARVTPTSRRIVRLNCYRTDTQAGEASVGDA